jgi:hypothetical protein
LVGCDRRVRARKDFASETVWVTRPAGSHLAS